MPFLFATPLRSCLTVLALLGLFKAPALFADPVPVEAKELPAAAADPFARFVSVGPKHTFETVYRVLAPGACPLLAYRVLILGYANYDSLVVEELAFSGSQCRDIEVIKSRSINGVTLGYALGEGTRFARNLEFRGWEAFDAFVIRSGDRDFRFSLMEEGRILAQKADRPADAGSSGP